MRKGRSSRRARSLRPLGGSTAPRSVEALSTEVESSPHVVLGVPRADEDTPTSRPPAAEGSVSARAEIDVVIPKLPPLAMAIVEQIAQDTEDLPATTPPPAPASPDDTSRSAPILEAARIVAEADALAAEAAAAEPETKTETTSEAVQAEVSPETKPAATELAKAETDSAKADEADEPAPDTHRSLPQVLATDADPPTDPDDVSVPPIGDIAVERFFSEGDVSRFEPDADESLTQPDKAARKSDPLVVQRRARFSRYVKWAVMGAGVLCVAAIGRTMVSSARSHASLASGSKQALVVELTPAPEAKAAPAAAAPLPSEQTQNAEAQPAAAEQAEPTEQPEALTGDAKEEKEKARKLLEQRKIADAIEAADRSVKLDSSDGEAWLILGAAYQEKGNMALARKAYASCVADAKTGPKQECAKMLR